MAKLVVNKISDTLILRACNTEQGSGGVARWLTGVQTRTLARCEEKAPVSDPRDRVHRPLDPGGTYRASFVPSGKIGNGHKIQRAITNVSPHAIFVERGRTASTKEQFYSSRKYPTPHWSSFTGERKGTHIMQEALFEVLRTSRAYHAHAILIRP